MKSIEVGQKYVVTVEKVGCGNDNSILFSNGNYIAEKNFLELLATKKVSNEMNDFFKELNKWLEEQKEDNSNSAELCTCFDEVPREWAFNWCAECYDNTLSKIFELRKKYHLN